MEDLLTTTFLQVPMRRWLISAVIAAGALAGALVVRWIAASLVRRRADRDAESTDVGGPQPRMVFALRMVQGFVFPALILAGFYVAVTTLGLEGRPATITGSLFVVIFSLVVVRFLVAVVNELFRKAAQDERRVDLSRIRPLRAIAVFAVWIAGLLFLLDNLGFDITAVIAGLGIGGIAVALAAQSLLGDLFSYFVIVFDRPFEIGDFVVFADVQGSVERIGVKTTRLRALDGEQIIVSNADLTGSRVRNYKRMERRRVVFRIGVDYSTPVAQLKEIPDLIRGIVEREEPVLFDRAHFASYGDWSLVFEVVYNVASPDYNLYMDIQQRINLAIYEAFAERGIEFAFPAQTIQIARGEAAEDAGDR